MFQLQRIFLTVTMVTWLLIQAQGADKYTDENRPYEFGFSIDGEQHRHEKKDKNGIIMGEYGFITADGVYHVTVYATDEFGHFKILSMKNIRVKPYPTVSSRQGHSLSLSPSSSQVPASQAQSPSQTLSLPHIQSTSPVIASVQPQLVQEAHKFESVKNELPSKSCSHCSLPTTTTRAPLPLPAPASTTFVESPPKYNNPIQIGKLDIGNPKYSQETQIPQRYPNPLSNPQQNSFQQNRLSSPQNYPQEESQQSPGSPQTFPSQPNNLKDINIPVQQSHPQEGFPQSPSSPDNNFGQQNYAQQGQQPSKSHPGQPVNEKPINNINNAINNPQIFSRFSQNSPDQQNSIERSGPQENNQGPSSVQQFLQQDVNTGNNNTPQQRARDTSSNDDSGSGPGQNYQSQPNGNSGGNLRSSKQYNPLEEPSLSFNSGGETTASGSPQPFPKKPILIAAQMQIVDKNTDIHYKRPGEQDGLPKGLTKDDMMHLLYTFNYTLGFQGHFEEGYTNGAKQGYYFVTGRNGVRTRVDYVADSRGFRPKISQEVLDLLSDEVPKPETEKDEKYGLKGYEFKWLYYPVETNAR